MWLLLAACQPVEPEPERPACTAQPPGDGDLDLFAGCAAGICRGQSLQEVLDVLGPEDDSASMTNNGQEQTHLFWDDVGLQVVFPDEDPEASDVIVRAPYPGTTEDGLGLGVELACFTELSEMGSTGTFLPTGETYVFFDDFALFVDPESTEVTVISM